MSDGAGGAIVIWQDKRSGSEYDIYAQRIDASGTRSGWPMAYPSASLRSNRHPSPQSATGGRRHHCLARQARGYDIYAQRVDSSGDAAVGSEREWHLQRRRPPDSPMLVEDGCGGAIIAWSMGAATPSTTSTANEFARPAPSSGHSTECPSAPPQKTRSPSGISDGAGGAIIVWQDSRRGPTATSTASGLTQQARTMGHLWPAHLHRCGRPAIAHRGEERRRWSHNRLAGRTQRPQRVYGQRVVSTGTAQWNADGVPICTAPQDQGYLSGTIDGSGGVVVTWQDSRNATKDIYAQRVQASGMLCRPPNQPGNLWPTDGEEGVSLTPTLKCSAFSPGVPGDSHAASQWRMTATAGDYSSPVFDSGRDTFGLRQVTVESGGLAGNATYYWQVRHLGSNGLWSLWSEETSFTTQNRQPNRPEGVWPENGATGIDLTPALRSSAFHDPDADDTHTASQWRVTTSPGNYASPVFSTPELTFNLTEVTVDSGRLTGHTAYYWQVRHQDDRGDWSDWSGEKSFTTMNRTPQRPAPVSPPSGTQGAGLSPTLESSGFSDPDTGDTHAASQWQIRAASGDYSTPVFASQTDNASLLSVQVPAGNLAYFTTYFWHVQYQDNHGAWSDWSEESSFTTQSVRTISPPPSPPDRRCVAPRNGAENVSTTQH